MKIDNVVFSCSTSEEYAPFWNIQAKIFKTKLGIEPVCLLFGKRSDTTMSDEHGQIIEMETDPSLPFIPQLTWSKFHYPTKFPDQTWLIGDIDLLPLQRAYFKEITQIPDDAYAHLNAGGISQARIGPLDGFLTQGSQVHVKEGRYGPAGCDLPGHYHCAKGDKFRALTQDRPFLEQVKFMVESDKFGLGPMGAVPKKDRESNAYWYYWCAEENYSSYLIYEAIVNKRINFVPVYYNNANNRDRINRDAFVNHDYVYLPERAAKQDYIDIHCVRPYGVQKDALDRILRLAWEI